MASIYEGYPFALSERPPDNVERGSAGQQEQRKAHRLRAAPYEAAREFPDEPPPDLPDCARVGRLGVLAAAIGGLSIVGWQTHMSPSFAPLSTRRQPRSVT